MGDFDEGFIHALAQQSWALYAVGMFLIILRMYARIHRLGFKGLQADDYLMVLAGCLYTILISCLNIIAGGGGSNLYVPDEFDTFSEEDILERIQGSKIVIVSEQAMLNVIYTIKCCMLIMYTRLTLGLTAQKLVRYLAIYVAIGWCATEIAFFTACRPFSGYWAMPPPDPQCTTLQNYAIVQACFNTTSDALMLFIPLPLVFRLSMPWKQKGVLIIIFSMGIFVIIAAILTKVFNLSNIWDPLYMLWYTREASVAVYVSNLPMIWPLLREYFPMLKALTPGQKSTNSPLGASSTGRLRVAKGTPGARHISHGFNDNRVTTTIRGTVKGESTEDLSSSETEMGIIGRQKSWDVGSGRPIIGLAVGPGLDDWDKDLKRGIQKVTTVHVTEEHVTDAGFESDEQAPRSAHRIHDVEKGKSWGL